LADAASSTVLSLSDIFCELTTGTTLAARKLFFGSCSTTRSFCGMAGDVLKMSDKLKTVLDAASAKLTTADLIKLNTAASGNAGIDTDQAARKWVQDNGFDKPVAK